MRDGERERIGGVGWRSYGERKNDADHLRDLRFVGATVRGNRALHTRGRIFEYFDLCAAAHHERDAAGVTELRRGLRIAMKENRFGARLIGLMRAHHFIESGLEHGEPRRERTITERDHAVRDVNEPRAALGDHAPSKTSCSGVEPENNHDRRASSSSEMSKSEYTF